MSDTTPSTSRPHPDVPTTAACPASAATGTYAVHTHTFTDTAITACLPEDDFRLDASPVLYSTVRPATDADFRTRVLEHFVDVVLLTWPPQTWPGTTTEHQRTQLLGALLEQPLTVPGTAPETWTTLAGLTSTNPAVPFVAATGHHIKTGQPGLAIIVGPTGHLIHIGNHQAQHEAPFVLTTPHLALERKRH